MSTTELPALLRDPERRAEAVAAVAAALAATGADPAPAAGLDGSLTGAELARAVSALPPEAIPVGALARLWLTVDTGIPFPRMTALVAAAPLHTVYRELLPLLTDDFAGLLVADLLACVIEAAARPVPASAEPDPDDADPEQYDPEQYDPEEFDPEEFDPDPRHPDPVGEPWGTGGVATGWDQTGYGQDPERRSRRLVPRVKGKSRVAWPALTAPGVVRAGSAFDVVVGIGDSPAGGVTGTGSLRIPRGDLLIEVTLVYDPAAFAPQGWANPVTLAVTRTNPFPRINLRLRALEGADLAVRREIGASYFVGGSLRGYGARTVQVTDGPGERLDLVDGEQLDLGPLLAAHAPDLVLVVERGADVRGQTLVWSAHSRLPGVVAAPGPHRCGIGDDPAGLARSVRLRMGAVADPRDAVLTLIGLGREIGDKVPLPVADAVRAVLAARAPDPPTVLLLSAEPHVPWELAVLGEPAEDRSPFLGARVALGRWVLDARRPRPTPPVRATGTGRAVVTARYEGVPGWNRLPSAEAEAAGLAAAYPPCAEVAPLHSAVLDFLESGPPARALHFALHGRFDPDNAQDGLVLLAPSPHDPNRLAPRFLSPEHVSSMSFRGNPFVFLNACQVGAGGTVLGDYSGLARAFLAAGACGVVAPLWNVDDVAAGAVAEAFYAAAYRGSPVAEALRGLRAAVDRRTRDGKPATTMAYQFFGHPRLALQL